MSFGKLNILQHKSWNVWNRDNIEKVLKDERLHREDEDKKRKRAEEAESEMRVQKLRALKSGDEGQDAREAVGSSQKRLKDASKDEGASTALVEVGEGVREHKGFNLFEGMERVIEGAVNNETSTSSGKNRDTEDDKKKEKEKNDRQWGMVGLGQDSFTGDSAAVKPWYAVAQDPSKATYEGPYQAANAHGSVPFGMENGKTERQAREEKKKRKSDPMGEMQSFLAKAREHKEKKKLNAAGRDAGRGRDDEAEKAAKMAKLRADRHAREQAERERVATIMGGVAPRGYLDARSGDRGGADGRGGRDGSSGGYNSGYNSGFAAFHGGIVRDRGQGGSSRCFGNRR